MRRRENGRPKLKYPFRKKSILYFPFYFTITFSFILTWALGFSVKTCFAVNLHITFLTYCFCRFLLQSVISFVKWKFWLLQRSLAERADFWGFFFKTGSCASGSRHSTGAEDDQVEPIQLNWNCNLWHFCLNFYKHTNNVQGAKSEVKKVLTPTNKTFLVLYYNASIILLSAKL